MRLQLLAHASEAGHPVCQVPGRSGRPCGRSLAEDERQTCGRCLRSAGETLAGVRLMFDELPDHVGHVRAQRYDADVPSAADGRPLPGGEVLVLLGKGSEGLAENGKTSRDGDPPSVSYELAWWANAWAEARGEAAPVRDEWPARRQVHAAFAYLDVFTRWAAQQHPAFGQYAADLHQLHARLERATGRAEFVEHAEAECFTCGSDALVRKQTDKGLDDHWTCGRCGRRYSWPEYILALRARLEDGRDQLRGVGWGTVRQVAAATGSEVATVRKWAQRGLVATCCLVESQEQLVWYPDADARAERSRRGEDRRTG